MRINGEIVKDAIYEQIISKYDHFEAIRMDKNGTMIRAIYSEDMDLITIGSFNNYEADLCYNNWLKANSKSNEESTTLVKTR